MQSPNVAQTQIDKRVMPDKKFLEVHINSHAHIGRIEEHTQKTSFNLLSPEFKSTRALIFIECGEALIQLNNKITELFGPSLTLVPIDSISTIKITADTKGYVANFSDNLTCDSLGTSAESFHLRTLVEQQVVLNRIDNKAVLSEVSHSFQAIENECSTANGSWKILSAHLSLIFVYLWRLSGLEDIAKQTSSNQSVILTKFRHLLENHFHEHLKISDYATKMNISHDRLHDTCMKTLGRTPLDLVHERLTHEASQRLLKSGLTIEQIAIDLGFKSTAHFSQFFNKKIGVPPGKFRSSSNPNSNK